MRFPFQFIFRFGVVAAFAFLPIATLGADEGRTLKTLTLADATAPQFKFETLRLETPLGDKPLFSRNPWDLHAFKGRLFIGHGDAESNSGSRNHFEGTPIWSYTPAHGFEQVSVQAPNGDLHSTLGGVDEEVITRFVEINGKLMIPGADPVTAEDWSLGNLYIYDESENRFDKDRSIPDGIHCLDLIGVNGDLYVALGNVTPAGKGQNNNRGTGAVVVVRPAGSQQWSTAFESAWTEPILQSVSRTIRVNELFRFDGQIYACEAAYGIAQNAAAEGTLADVGGKRQSVSLSNEGLGTVGGSARIAKLDPKQRRFIPTDLPYDQVYPLGNQTTVDVTTADGQVMTLAMSTGNWMANPVEFNHQLFYLGLGGGRRDLYHASANFETVTPVPVADGIMPQKIMVHQDHLYVLAFRKLENDRYQNAVFETVNAEDWSLTWVVETETFARSFATMGPDWYLGLGGNAESTSPATGTILRVSPVM